MKVAKMILYSVMLALNLAVLILSIIELNSKPEEVVFLAED